MGGWLLKRAQRELGFDSQTKGAIDGYVFLGVAESALFLKADLVNSYVLSLG